MLTLVHKELKVYQIILDFIKEVYKLTESFPKDEQFSLTRQVKRASVSVCCNMAEGASRQSNPEKRRFYTISRSSLVEVDTQLEIALVLKFVKKEQLVQLDSYIESIFKILSTMINNRK